MIDKNSVLSCSARDYIDSRGKMMEDYVFFGVHSNFGALEEIIRDAPQGAEVIVDYRHEMTISQGHSVHHQFGTALVLK